MAHFTTNGQWYSFAPRNKPLMYNRNSDAAFTRVQTWT